MEIEFAPFYPRQTEESRKKYISLIMGMAQASYIYSDSPKPYLPYRVAERIFCKSFSAEDVTRRDLSVDAVKIKDGIGIKTFVSGSSADKFEKIAEFVNRTKYPLDEKNIQNMITQVAEYRNKRIRETIKSFDLSNTVYHYLVRDIRRIYICECAMIPIDIDSIRLTSNRLKGNIIKFSDKYFSYYFHLSKHTLFKEFSYKAPFYTIKIEGYDRNLLTQAIEELSNRETLDPSLLKNYDYVLLPLYSTILGEVPERSGLNQWNAGGRKRDYDEVYIPIPSIVHKKKPGFFPPRDHKFVLKTQDGREFSAKVCQANNKALMTDPNKDLGKWLLRDMLGLARGEIATLEHLRRKNADSVIIYKLKEDVFQISLHSFGGFEKEYDVKE